MRVCASFLMSLTFCMARPPFLPCEWPASIAAGSRTDPREKAPSMVQRGAKSARADQRADRLAAHDAHQVAWARHIVDAQRNVVIAAERNRAGVHDLQIALDHIFVGKMLVALGVRI